MGIAARDGAPYPEPPAPGEDLLHEAGAVVPEVEIGIEPAAVRVRGKRPGPLPLRHVRADGPEVLRRAAPRSLCPEPVERHHERHRRPAGRSPQVIVDPEHYRYAERPVADLPVPAPDCHLPAPGKSAMRVIISYTPVTNSLTASLLSCLQRLRGPLPSRRRRHAPCRATRHSAPRDPP